MPSYSSRHIRPDVPHLPPGLQRTSQGGSPYGVLYHPVNGSNTTVRIEAPDNTAEYSQVLRDQTSLALENREHTSDTDFFHAASPDEARKLRAQRREIRTGITREQNRPYPMA